MKNLQVIEVKGQRVLTTKQIAELYGTEVVAIQQNFRYNKKNYQLGKHYIELSGKELQEFKANPEIYDQIKYAKHLYLWTEKGALLHAKSLNTDKAWEVYDYLVDFYFHAKKEDGEKQASGKNTVVPIRIRVEKIYEGIEEKSAKRLSFEDSVKMDVFTKLIHLAEDLGGEVHFVTFKSKSEGMMAADSNLENLRIGIKSGMDFEKYMYNIAHELASYFLHYDKGDTITSDRHKKYEEQADRGAKMLLKALAVK